MSRILLKATLGFVMRVLFRPKVEGIEGIPGSGPVILAGNHVTFIDSLFLSLIVEQRTKRQVYFIAKDEYVKGKGVKGRLMAWFFTTAGMIPVDRDGGHGGVAALMTGRRVLEQGKVFGIYPEGTRSPDGRLYRGRTGIARLTLMTGAPVVPFALIGTDKVQPGGKGMPRVAAPRGGGPGGGGANKKNPGRPPRSNDRGGPRGFCCVPLPRQRPPSGARRARTLRWLIRQPSAARTTVSSYVTVPHVPSALTPMPLERACTPPSAGSSARTMFVTWWPTGMASPSAYAASRMARRPFSGGCPKSLTS